MPSVETEEKASKIALVSEQAGYDSRQKMEELSEEIFQALKLPVDLNVKTEDHIAPHHMLAVSHGLLYPDTASKAEALLKEVLSTVKDEKKKEFLKNFLRREQAAI